MQDSLLFCIALMCMAQCFLQLASAVNCQNFHDCESCVSQSSGFLPCLWCPKDEECHKKYSLVNPCSKTEIIHDASKCGQVHLKYDPTTAYKMLFLSALAYANDVAKYIPKATVVKSFRLIKQVTETCPSGGAWCSAFLAVSEQEQIITVAFRGSENIQQLMKQALSILKEPKVDFISGGKVQDYFNRAFQLVWNKLRSDFYDIKKTYPTYKIWITGHSLGGALASLLSTTIAYEGQRHDLYLYTFGQPRVGDYNYALSHDSLLQASFRVTHLRDPVVHLPTCFKIAFVCTTTGPYHHGSEIYYKDQIMTQSSLYKECNGLPYNEDMKCSNNPITWGKCYTSSQQLLQCIQDHKIYFNIHVGEWWKDQTV